MGQNNFEDFKAVTPVDLKGENLQKLEPNAEQKLGMPQDPGNSPERNTVAHEYALQMKQSENTREAAVVKVEGQNVPMRIQHAPDKSVGTDAHNNNYNVRLGANGNYEGFRSKNEKAVDGTGQNYSYKASIKPEANLGQTASYSPQGKLEAKAANAPGTNPHSVLLPEASQTVKPYASLSPKAAQATSGSDVGTVSANVSSSTPDATHGKQAITPGQSQAPERGGLRQHDGEPEGNWRHHVGGYPQGDSSTTKSGSSPQGDSSTAKSGNSPQGDSPAAKTGSSPQSDSTAGKGSNSPQDSQATNKVGPQQGERGARPINQLPEQTGAGQTGERGTRFPHQLPEQTGAGQTVERGARPVNQQPDQAGMGHQSERSTRVPQQSPDQASTSQQGERSTKPVSQQSDQASKGQQGERSTRPANQGQQDQATGTKAQQPSDQSTGAKAGQKASDQGNATSQTSDQANAAKQNLLSQPNLGEQLLKTGNAGLDQDLAARLKGLNPEQRQELAKLLEQSKGLDQIAAQALGKIEGLIALSALEKSLLGEHAQEHVEGQLRVNEPVREMQATGQILDAARGALNAAGLSAGHAEAMPADSVRTVSNTTTPEHDANVKANQADASQNQQVQNAALSGQAKAQANQTNIQPANKQDTLIAQGPNSPFTTRPDGTIISGGADKGTQGAAHSDHNLADDKQASPFGGHDAGKAKHKNDQPMDGGLPFGIPAVPFGFQDAGAKRADKKAEEKEKEEEKSKKVDPDQREKYVVKLGDTLESIAGSRLGDAALAKLIFEINKDNIFSYVQDGKQVIELQPELVLWLPSQIDIQEFRNTQGKQGQSTSETLEYLDQKANPEQELAAWEEKLKAKEARKANVEKLLGPLAAKPDSESGRIKYTVRLGDTLRTIAMKHPALQDVRLWTLLAEVNKIETEGGANIPKLKRGTAIFIPASEEIAAFRAQDHQRDAAGKKTKLELATKPCPECLGLTIQDATICPRCGYSFGETKPVQLFDKMPGDAKEKGTSTPLPKSEEVFGAANFAPEANPISAEPTEHPVTETFVHEEASQRHEEIVQKLSDAVKAEPESKDKDSAEEDPTTTILIAAGLLPAQTKVEDEKTNQESQDQTANPAPERQSANQIPTELNGPARLLSETCRLTEIKGDVNQAQALSLEVEQNGKWQPVVTYEIYSDISFRHEYVRDGKRRTIRVDLPPHAVKELAETDLSANWQRYSQSFFAGKRPTQ